MKYKMFVKYLKKDEVLNIKTFQVIFKFHKNMKSSMKVWKVTEPID